MHDCNDKAWAVMKTWHSRKALMGLGIGVVRMSVIESNARRVECWAWIVVAVEHH